MFFMFLISVFLTEILNISPPQGFGQETIKKNRPC